MNIYILEIVSMAAYVDVGSIKKIIGVGSNVKVSGW